MPVLLSSLSIDSASPHNFSVDIYTLILKFVWTFKRPGTARHVGTAKRIKLEGLHYLIHHVFDPQPVESELHLLAYTTVPATRDPSLSTTAHGQPWILNPLSEAGDGTRILMDPSRVC